MSTTSPFDEFDVVIRRKEAGTIAAIPLLGLYGTGTDVQSALDVLEEKKRRLSEDLSDDDLDLIDHLKRRQLQDAMGADTRRFAARSGILVALVTVGLMLVSYYAASRVQAVVDRARLAIEASDAGRLLTALDRSLERAAATELSEEQKQRMISNMRKVAEQWRPIIEAAT